MATHLARSGLFAIKLTPSSADLEARETIRRITQVLRQGAYAAARLDFVSATSGNADGADDAPLDLGPMGGKLWILQAREPTSTLSAMIRLYEREPRLVTINLEEVNSIAQPVTNGSGSPAATAAPTGPAGPETVGLRLLSNVSLDRTQDELAAALGGDTPVERVPIIKRAQSVPNYYTSSDDRILEYDYDEVLFHAKTPYQDVKILHSRTLGASLILDDLQNLAEADLAYTRGLMHLEGDGPVSGVDYYRDKEILILGGGDGALLHELLKESPRHVTMVDIDGVVVGECAKRLRGACGSALDNLTGDNYEVLIGDCLAYMSDAIARGRTWDVIFNDLTDIPISGRDSRDLRSGWVEEDNAEEQAKLWTFVRSILTLAMQCLRDGGRYLNHAIGAGCTNALANYEQVLRTMPYELEFVQHSAYVPSFMENWVFYDVTKKGPKAEKA